MLFVHQLHLATGANIFSYYKLHTESYQPLLLLMLLVLLMLLILPEAPSLPLPLVLTAQQEHAEVSPCSGDSIRGGDSERGGLSCFCRFDCDDEDDDDEEDGNNEEEDGGDTDRLWL